MGEIANMILDGFLSEDTGEVIDGTSPGYVRRMSDARCLRITTDAEHRERAAKRNRKRKERRKKAAARTTGAAS